MQNTKKQSLIDTLYLIEINKVKTKHKQHKNNYFGETNITFDRP